jgi:hypothetical protein
VDIQQLSHIDQPFHVMTRVWRGEKTMRTGVTMANTRLQPVQLVHLLLNFDVSTFAVRTCS